MTTRENQEILFIPTNDISNTIWYISQDNDSNQRLIVDVPCEHPNVWQVSKVEKVNVRGRTKITLYQTEFYPNSDYIEKDSEGNIIGMWADYYSNVIVPENQTDLTVDTTSDDLSSSSTETTESTVTLSLSSSTNTIKVGGSYKLISSSLSEEKEITSYTWKAFINDTEVTDDTSILTWSNQTDQSKIKVKFTNNRKYLNKILTIKCIANCVDESNISSTIDLEITI